MVFKQLSQNDHTIICRAAVDTSTIALLLAVRVGPAIITVAVLVAVTHLRKEKRSLFYSDWFKLETELD